MPKRKKPEYIIDRQFPPATTDEARERQVISLAYDLAERQIREGTATSQVLTHFLRLGTERERLEREILTEQKKLVAAKTENLESSKRIEALYSDAMKAMRRYQGVQDEDEY